MSQLGKSLSETGAGVSVLFPVLESGCHSWGKAYLRQGQGSIFYSLCYILDVTVGKWLSKTGAGVSFYSMC